MSVKKGCLLAGVGVVIIAAGVVALVFWLTGGAVESGEAFLSQLGQGQTQAAYDSASVQFKAQTDPETFEAFVRRMSLDQFASASWTSRSVKNNQAELEGSIQTKEGATVPLTISLIKEDGSWKVLSISGPAAGVSTEDSARPIPSDADLQRLASGTLVGFKSAVETGDFTEFHASVSTLWRNQTDPGALGSAFREFIDQQIGLDALAATPTFNQPPGIDENGVLHLRGYATAPEAPQFNFELKYIYEHPEWKLIGLTVNAGRGGESESQEGASPPAEAGQPVPGEPVPGEPEAPISSPQGQVASSDDAYVIRENASLSGRLGRLVVQFPDGSQTSGAKIEVYRSGEQNAAASSYGAIEADLLPGRYDVVVTGVRLSGVEVASARDTWVRVGALRIRVGSGTKVQVYLPGDSAQTEPVASGYGALDFGLPIGAYEVEIAGQRDQVVIDEGRITEF